MDQRIIPSEEWLGFLKDFSRLHEGQTVTIDVMDPEKGTQHLAQHVPLVGLSLDTLGTRPASLEIAAGDLPQGLIRHVIDLPMTIELGTASERDVLLSIEPARGGKTLVTMELQ